MRTHSSRGLWVLILVSAWLIVPAAQHTTQAHDGCVQDGGAPDAARAALSTVEAASELTGPQTITLPPFSNDESFGRTDSRPGAWSYPEQPIVIPCKAGGPNPPKIDITLRGDNGDADLYARFGARPDDPDQPYAGRGYIPGSNEDVTINTPCDGFAEPRELYIGVRSWSEYSNAIVEVEFEVPEPEPAKKQDCLDTPKADGTHGDLPPEIKAGWGTPDRRNHHSTWHSIEFGWDRLSPAQQRELRAVGWGPPEDCDESGENCTRHSQEQLGLDFVCMHRNMVEITNNAYAALAARDNEIEPCRVRGWTEETIPWNLPDSNRENDRLWPTPGTPNRIKGEQSARDMRRQASTTFFSEDWLTGNGGGSAPSLGQMMRAVERSFHNWMHMRFADDRPNGDVCATDWLGSTCSSQQNEYFWKLHGLIDSLPNKWARANAGTTAALIRGVPVEIPASFGLPEGHADRASDDEVHEFTSRLMGFGEPIEGVPQHNCWMGPMPGPIRIDGAPVRGLMNMPMSAEMVAANVEKTNRAIEIMSDESLGPDVFQNWVSDSIRQSILTVPQMMAAILDPAEKAKIVDLLEKLATDRGQATWYRDPVTFEVVKKTLAEDERDLLIALLNAPEDFQRLTPVEANLLQKAIDKLKIAPDPLAEELRDIIRANPAVMEIPEVQAALSQSQ